VVGCDKPARAGTEDGLDTRLCRTHSDFYSRHGSPYQRSYTAAELAPFRRAAEKWLKANIQDHWVQNARQRIQTLYQNAGPHIEAFRLRGLPPKDRGKAAWARLRKAKVDPLRVIAAWLAVEMAIVSDPRGETKKEFKQVQAAKLVHRMSSGTHKRWGEGPSAKELHVYPRSRGRVLRYIGSDIAEAVELLIANCILPKAHH